MISVDNKTDHILLDFQTDVSVVVHTTIETVQLISHTRPAITNTISTPQGFKEEDIPVHRSQSKIYCILDETFSKHVGNTAHIEPFFSILLPGNILKSELYNSFFFIVISILFSLVRLVFMAVLTGFWYKPSNNLLSCHRLQSL